MSQNKLKCFRLGPVVVGFKRSSDNKWERDGRMLPWLCFLPVRTPGFDGGSIIVGGIFLGIMWRSKSPQSLTGASTK
jgi:hypothetical protein